MMLTPARTDLPKVGDVIAAMQGSRQWYLGPFTVLAVDEEKKIVEVRPENWKHEGTVVYAPVRPGVTVFNGQDFVDPGEANPIYWNKIEDLREDERP